MADRIAIIAPMSQANTPEIQTSAGVALAANPVRGLWQIQNVGTNPIFIRLGAGASSTLYHAVIKGGTGNDDGLGGSWGQDNGCVYTGVISIAGTSPRFVVTELTQ